MSSDKPDITGAVCPTPLPSGDRIQLAHGGGGRRMAELIRDRIGPVVGEQACAHDGAVLELGGARVGFTTDSFVVSPLFFPGGDIGTLAVCGTVNDLAMTGAKPVALSLGLILEEGLPMETLDRVLASIRRSADEAGVTIATGDTKVVDRGKGDGVFVNTAGVGEVKDGVDIGPWRIREGDAIVVSGDVGRHGVAILSVREGLEFDGPVRSDCAPLGEPVAALLDAGVDVRCLRDSTRGGLAAALCEIARDAASEIQLDEAAIPVLPTVQAACEILGLSPLHLACEGRFVAFVAEADVERTVEVLRGFDVCAGAVAIGRVAGAREGGRVWLNSPFGGSRLLDLPSGEQLPRIC